MMSQNAPQRLYLTTCMSTNDKRLTIHDRPSDSPFVAKIWRAHSEHSAPFLSVAASHWQMVVTYYKGQAILTVRGPETKVTAMALPPDGEWFGICFKIGTVMPHLPASTLINRDLNLPKATGRSFWLHGSTWQLPNFENADTFVGRLVRAGLLVREPVVEAVLHDHPLDLSLRTAQRRFLRTTGLTHNTIRQIERARYATLLIQQGLSLADVVHAAGYYDQPHLNHALRHFIGQSPTQLIDRSNPTQLSFIYKTTQFPQAILPSLLSLI